MPATERFLGELARCAKNPHLRRGLKLHFGNSFVEYLNPAHIEQVRRVFRAANGYGMAATRPFCSSTSSCPRRPMCDLGVQRILFGSDAPLANNLPTMTWAAFTHPLNRRTRVCV